MNRDGHRWAPFLDLSDADLAAASGELPALASLWGDERKRLADDQALSQFSERLQREWAIESGGIERGYSLDRSTTRLLIEKGIDVALISHDATDQPPELVAAIINYKYTAVEWLFDFVGAQRPLTMSFGKELHALMTRNQRTAAGVDQLHPSRTARAGWPGRWARWCSSATAGSPWSSPGTSGAGTCAASNRPTRQTCHPWPGSSPPGRRRRSSAQEEIG